MNRFFLFCLVGLGASLPLKSQQSNDSISTAEPIKLAAAGDTLVQLNILNRGVLEFQVGSLDSNWFRTGQDASLILKKDLYPGTALPMVEIKTKTAEKEYYDNRIFIYATAQRLLIQVSSDKIEMATGMRANGKIWVVIAVVFVLFFTLIGLLLYQQSTLRRLEKQIP